MSAVSEILLPYQRRILAARQRKKLWLSARQVGKSTTAAFLAVKAALEKKNGLSLCVSTGGRAAAELIRKAEQVAQAVEILEPSIAHTSSVDSIKFTGGSRVISLPSGNPQALRGWSADAVILDEAAFLEQPEDVWQSLVPTLTRNPDAQLVVTSTPAGKSGLFYELYQQALGDPSWYVQETTIIDAVHDGLRLDVESLKKTVGDPDVFDQEYMCRWADSYGELIDTELLEFVDEIPKTAKISYMGMDVGSKSDRTAIVTILQDGEAFYVADIFVMHKASYESQLEAVRTLHEKHRYSAGYVDANGIGSALAEFTWKKVSARIRPYTWTAKNKTPAYEYFRSLVFDRRLKFFSPLKDTVIRDFRNVRRIVTEAGTVVFEAGRDSQGHSDVCSALVLGL